MTQKVKIKESKLSQYYNDISAVYSTMFMKLFKKFREKSRIEPGPTTVYTLVHRKNSVTLLLIEIIMFNIRPALQFAIILLIFFVA